MECRLAVLKDLPAMNAWQDWHHAKRESIVAGECHVAVMDEHPIA